MIKTQEPEGLEERFKEPEGFRFHSFEREGRNIRFGSVSPKDSIPDATVVCLPGLSEPIEKYYETARDLLDKNLAVWIIDWMGQGGSGRYLDNPHKRHAASFDEDVKDLHYLIMEYIKHSSVSPDKGRIPMAMLSHSLGGNIGVRYLEEHDDIFECAGLSTPFFGIPGISNLPEPVLLPLARVFKEIAGSKYAKGQKDWSQESRSDAPGTSEFSTDSIRDTLHKKWLEANPELQIGGVTYAWVYQALASCRKIKKAAANIQTPILIGMAGQDTVVHNDAIEAVHNLMPNSDLIEFPDAQHEIIMEQDSIRTPFLDGFYDLIHKNIIEKPETLKPF